MARLGPTPSQTVGPYFSMVLGGQNALLQPGGAAQVRGERIRIEGRVLDSDGATIEDALIEVWQANAAGRYRHEADDRKELDLDDGFTGFGRAETDFATGLYWFETIKPGRVPDPEGELQAPHISVIVQARGMLKPSFTRMYFPEEEAANDADLVLRMVPTSRRHTLIAQLADGIDPKVYRFDIRFQGEDETVFFDF